MPASMTGIGLKLMLLDVAKEAAKEAEKEANAKLVTALEANAMEEAVGGTGENQNQSQNQSQSAGVGAGMEEVVEREEMAPSVSVDNAVSEEYEGFSPLERSVAHVLRAYLHKMPQPGYVQGMAMIAVHLLAFCDEESSFWMMCNLVDSLLPRNFFAEDMLGYVHMCKTECIH